VETLFLALALASLAGAAIWLWLREQATVLVERLRAREEENVRLSGELAEARSQVTEITNLKSQAEQALATERASAAVLLTSEQRRYSEQEQRAAAALADLEKMRAALQTEFQVVAAKLLDEKSAKFTEHNKAQLDILLSPLKQQLADFRARVDTVYKTDGDDRASLRTQIEQLRLLNSRITDEAHALTQALKGQSQVRGAWGELVLERLLVNSGLRRGEDFVVQESVVGADGRSRMRPDIILRLPDQRHLVIDSKVSLVDYEQAVNAAEPAARETFYKAHAAAVRRHVESLSKQQYQDAGGLISPDYVLMFVPLEPAFMAALDTDKTLYEWAFDRRVILVTAPTLLATLKTVASLWKQDRQTRNVMDIAKRGGLLYDKFALLLDDLEDVGRHLGKARESYDEVIGKLKTGRGNLIAQVEELKTLGAKAQKSLPPADPDSTSA
jgi:DNA recombination protein RmuC